MHRAESAGPIFKGKLIRMFSFISDSSILYTMTLILWEVLTRKLSHDEHNLELTVFHLGVLEECRIISSEFHIASKTRLMITWAGIPYIMLSTLLTA